MDDMVRAVKPF
jgi:hypothetical protein